MDVFIDEEFRGLGLSKWLMDCIDLHPSLQGFRRWTLNTRDAHGLYEKSGFRRVVTPGAYMERVVSNPYCSGAVSSTTVTSVNSIEGKALPTTGEEDPEGQEGVERETGFEPATATLAIKRGQSLAAASTEKKLSGA
jgi:hypothetical protein